MSLIALLGSKRGASPEVGTDPLVLEPVGKVRRPVVAVQV